MKDIQQLTEQIIGAAIEVHRTLGPGFLESIYEEAMTVELALRGLRFKRQAIVPIMYKERQVGEHRLDLTVEDLVVVENKAVHEIDPVFYTVVRSYLRATRLEVGLLFNFATMPLTIKRVGSKPFATIDQPPDFRS
jgi:GxxExxY protein